MSYYVKSKDGTKLYVEDLNKNSNKTIVFLHGWPGSHELFEYQYDYFIKEGYRCIGIDRKRFWKI